VRPFASGENSALANDRHTSSLRRDEGRDRALAEVRATLSPEERTLLELRVDEKLRWSEIAERLSRPGAPVSAATLMKRFERLKERLARRLRVAGLMK
jgi:RNA polymerase sigma-70 factor (ECF subfamily)